jgi:PEP-CTERM motif
MTPTVLVARFFHTAVLFAAFTVGATPANASTILFQNFDDVTALAGWTTVNNSDPGGVTGWFQGNDGVFSSQGGAPDSYIAANFLNAGAGAISNWLILPELSFNTGDALSFYTRSSGFLPDRLEVRFSVGSGADVGATPASVGTFTTLFLTLNPALNVGGYPTDWTQYTLNLSLLDGLSGRLAFRYNIDDNLVNGDYIGIDTVTVSSATPTPVPEPGTLTLLGLGVAGLVARRRHLR